MIVQLPIQSVIHRVVVVYRIRPACRILPSTVAQPRRNIIPIPILTYLQIALCPALSPYLDSLIDIPIDIGYRGNP